MTNTHNNLSNKTVVYVTEHRIGCDGGGGALGHPLTYYTLDAHGQAVCRYCDKIFVYQGKH
jgi:uncharacterized Zn-finger protein